MKSRQQKCMIFCMIVIGSILLNISSAYSQQHSPAQFRPSEVFNIGWGTDSGEVGLLKVPGENYGPQSFAVDEGNGNIYVLDSTNSRVLVFDSGGDIISDMPINEKADDLCLDDTGHIYVLYKNEMKVIEYDAIGSELADYPIPDTTAPILGIHFNENDKSLFFETVDGVTYPIVEKGCGIKTREQANRRKLGFVRGNNYFLFQGKKPALKILDSIGRVEKEVILQPREKRIETLRLIGVDSGNNVYINADETSLSSRARRYLRRYNQEGQLIAEALIPYSNYVYTFKDLRVTGNGDVYQILPLQDGVKVLLWNLNNDDNNNNTKSVLSMENSEELFSCAQPSDDDFLSGESADENATSANQKQLFPISPYSISQNEIMARAEAYRTHSSIVQWSNITSGSTCPSDGTYVETSVSTPKTCQGVLYRWGGFSGLTNVTQNTDFNTWYDEGLLAGKYAGDIYTTGYVSACAVGVDCSGFVSQTWGLSKHYGAGTSVNGLASLSTQLTSLNDLSAGDILLWAGNHVRLFANRENDGSFTVYEASARDWKVSRNNYPYRKIYNIYTPYSYNNLGAGPSVTYFKINNGATSTTSRNVTLNNTASGSPTQYMASEASTFSDATWQPYSTAPGFALSSGSGVKTIYFKVRNSSNVESTIVNKSITLNESDFTPPTTVQITAPTSGQTVSGIFTFQGTAQDNSGTIQKIKFYIDSDTSPACKDMTAKPSGSTFSCSWDTANKPDGAHSVTATAYDPSGNSASSTAVSFTISNGSSTPVVTVTSPNGGETLQVGTTQSITWTVKGTSSQISYFKVAYSLDGGTTFTNISATPSATDRSLNWTIPSTMSGTQCRIRVSV